MVTLRDYTAESVEAARSVLIELVHLLGEYKDDMDPDRRMDSRSPAAAPRRTSCRKHGCGPCPESQEDPR